ncbi:hypothetical protein FHW03_001391 [Ochrobactrum sp. RH2CCR150]|nr:hypothetical protein [Ochrobactrum sp. RH2CCR150]
MRLGGSTWTENTLSANHLNDAMRSHERRMKFALRSTFARLYQRFSCDLWSVCTRNKAKVKQATVHSTNKVVTQWSFA